MKKYVSMPEAAEKIGVSYGRIYYAVLKRVVEPMQSGRARLFSEKDIERLKSHFEDGRES